MEIVLRPYLENDFDILFKIRNDFEIQYMLMTNPKPNTKSKTLQWIENKAAANDSVFFIISNEVNETIGYIQAVKINQINKNCNIGIALEKKWWGKGIAGEALLNMEYYLKNTYNLKKVVVEILFENINSIKSFTKANYKQVGVLQKHFYAKNKFHDVCILEKFI